MDHFFRVIALNLRGNPPFESHPAVANGRTDGFLPEQSVPLERKPDLAGDIGIGGRRVTGDLYLNVVRHVEHSANPMRRIGRCLLLIVAADDSAERNDPVVHLHPHVGLVYDAVPFQLINHETVNLGIRESALRSPYLFNSRAHGWLLSRSVPTSLPASIVRLT